MNTKETIEQRRAVKHYDPNHQMSESEIQELFDLAILSPTSFNIQNWRFVLATEPELCKQLRAAAFDQAQIEEASATLILCADLKAWDKEPGRYWRNTPEEVQNMILPMLKNLYEGNEQLQRDEAIRSIGIAAQTVMLAAKEMGYDTCPMIGFEPDKVAELINLPEDHLVGLIITIGKPLKEAHPRPGQLSLKEVFIKERF